MRTAFIETLTRLAAKKENIFLLSGDLGFSVLENFIAKFPKQYLNIGVAEQNMIGIAAGLAHSGKTVFAYSIIPFITLRCLEQIRNDIAMQNLNVKLVGVGEGFSYGQLGPTHHSLEDIAIMRTIPQMTVICPGDPWEVENATITLAKLKTPAYLRIGKKGEPKINKPTAKFTIGKGIILTEGKDATLISTGNMLEAASKVVDTLKKEGLLARLISMHTVKPLDEKLILESAKTTGAIFTVEEHSIIGGLGSAVAEFLMRKQLEVKFYSFGVNDKFTKMAGSQEYLRKVNGLGINQMTEKIIKILRKN